MIDIVRLHPRTLHVRKAGNEIARAILDVVDRAELTPAELVSILAGEIIQWNKYTLRAERHPAEPDKKADEE